MRCRAVHLFCFGCGCCNGMEWIMECETLSKGSNLAPKKIKWCLSHKPPFLQTDAPIWLTSRRLQLADRKPITKPAFLLRDLHRTKNRWQSLA
ncbi:hypothetical protein BCR44DRAFT_331377 [Catenaria anguillulae PL171]|uniref:Uncharacterized protein n=1 Tax=Catenaria anguillulae PL171 TaxID=765915 RepID=A0A1Y2HL22_9FUNG|nr:hypothetical protein BCR44DRAFT_331377 [Catenaria anguillulae PL171]